MMLYLHFWESSQRELRLIFRTPLDGLPLGRPLAVKKGVRESRERRERREGGRGGRGGREGGRRRTLH